ncbi:unnamed protein product [Symbiodinium sp. CCMP2592]|nr:unnamed protein product [Symbiodinium sp. CCMP2592]
MTSGQLSFIMAGVGGLQEGLGVLTFYFKRNDSAQLSLVQLDAVASQLSHGNVVRGHSSFAMVRNSAHWLFWGHMPSPTFDKVPRPDVRKPPGRLFTPRPWALGAELHTFTEDACRSAALGAFSGEPP